MNLGPCRLDGKSRGGGIKRIQVFAGQCAVRNRVGIIQQRDVGKLRRDLLKYRKQLAGDRRIEIGEPSNIAARPGYACGKSTADRVGDDYGHDWNCSRRSNKLSDYRRTVANNDSGSQSDKLFRKTSHSVGIACSKTIVDMDIVANDPAELAKALLECVDPGACLLIIRKAKQKSD